MRGKRKAGGVYFDGVSMVSAVQDLKRIAAWDLPRLYGAYGRMGHLPHGSSSAEDVIPRVRYCVEMGTTGAVFKGRGSDLSIVGPSWMELKDVGRRLPRKITEFGIARKKALLGGVHEIANAATRYTRRSRT